MGIFKRKPVDPEIQAAYDKAYREERIKLAEERGRAAGKNPPKPFYKKVTGAVSTVGKAVISEVGKPAPKGRKPKGDVYGFFFGENDAPKRRVKHKKRRKR